MVCPTALYVVGLALLASARTLFWLAVTVNETWFEVRPLPEAVALLVIEPASMSAWVIVCLEVQFVDPPNASGPLPQGLIVPCLSSLTLNGPASVVFPLFVIVYVYVITCPTARSQERRVVKTCVRPGVCVAVTVAVAELDVTPLPEALAVLTIEPASISAWVMACVEVQLVDAPGASGPLPHGLIVPCLSSVTLNGPERVVFPLLVSV